MRKLYLTAMVAAATFLFSCKKDETTNTAPDKTPTQRLQANGWKKGTYKENGTAMSFYAACEADDVITFKTDGNWVLSDGANVCTSPHTTTDFYSVLSDNKTMRWGSWGEGELTFSADYSSFTFKRTGANTFEYTFTRN